MVLSKVLCFTGEKSVVGLYFRKCVLKRGFAFLEKAGGTAFDRLPPFVELRLSRLRLFIRLRIDPKKTNQINQTFFY